MTRGAAGLLHVDGEEKSILLNVDDGERDRIEDKRNKEIRMVTRIYTFCLRA